MFKYYNPEEDLIVKCEASDTVLRATVMKGRKPVAFRSRALTPTEQGYAQIEKFHQYTYGWKSFSTE